MAATANHIVNSRRLKKGTLYLTGLILTGMGGWSGVHRIQNPEHPNGTRYSRTQIKERAIEIGLALNGSVRVVGEPMLHEEQTEGGASYFSRRNMWIVLCESGGRQMNLTFDDTTGRLSCLIMDGSAFGAQEQLQQIKVRTEKDAVIAAAAKLRVLNTLPLTAKIALDTKPVEVDKQNIWYVTWLVKNTAKSAPYTIKMALNRQTGLPTYLMSLERKG